MSGFVSRFSEKISAGRSMSEAWMRGNIDAWHAEGRISEAEVSTLQRDVGQPAFQEILPHLGVHVGIALAIPFPFASLARSFWTLVMLLIATVRFIARRLDRSAWRHATEVHSPLVALIGFLPVVGVFAYFAAKPVRSNQLLFRVGIDAVMLRTPWNLYERSGLRGVIAR